MSRSRRGTAETGRGTVSAGTRPSCTRTILHRRRWQSAGVQVSEGRNTFTGLAADVLAAPARLGGTRLVCVDGPAGSGKTTFGRRLAEALDAPLVQMDDLYAGWTPVGAAARLAAGVLRPLRGGRPGAYHRYDWHAGAFGTEPTAVPAAAALVVEGCGSSPAALAPLTTLRVWVEAPAQLRLRRGLERDGEALGAEWLDWLQREAVLFARERTRARADLLVDGAPVVPDSPGFFTVLADRTSVTWLEHRGRTMEA
jgi:uridine kinase